MGTDNTAALTRASRKLKELASDAISIPITQELADRKSVELHDARRKLDEIVQRQLKIEKGTSSDKRAVAAIVAEKAAAIAVIARLEGESALLEAAVLAEKPAVELTPTQRSRQAFFNGLANLPEPDEARDATIREARAEVDRLVKRELRGRYEVGRALFSPDPTEAAELRKARARLAALENVLPEYRGHVTKEDYIAAKKELNLK